MKKVLGILFILCFALGSFGQIAKSKTLTRKDSKQDYSYYAFPMTAGDTLTGGGNTSATFTVDLNKHELTSSQWYVEIDTIGAPDSANFDIKMNYVVFTDNESYTTVKTVTWDGDANGDYASAVRDSTSVGAITLTQNAPEFARRVQLSITPTTGPGIGVGSKVKILKVILKVHSLK